MWFLRNYFFKNESTTNDMADHPLVLSQNMCGVFLYITDAEIVKELMTTKNQSVDKDKDYQNVARDLFGNTFLFSPADETWKKKRKGSAHAFR